MFNVITKSGKVLQELNYSEEKDFEKEIVINASKIFGNEGIYFDIKKKIGISNKGASIPDGYFLDLAFHDKPMLYFVEIELSSHDVYGHIGNQILKFSIASELTKYKIKSHLINEVNKNIEFKNQISKFILKSKFDNVNQLLDYLIFDIDPAVVIIIDHADEQLSKVLSKLKISSEVLEFQTYKNNDEVIHLFTPFREELQSQLNNEFIEMDDLDTIVVPAKEEGFKDVFLNGKCWYKIRISLSMLDKLKYIAAYQTAPISAITHIAEIDKIEKYKETDKYILYFKDNAKEINHIILDGGKGIAPQAPRYTSFSKLKSAKSLEELWK